MGIPEVLISVGLLYVGLCVYKGLHEIAAAILKNGGA